MRRGNRSEAQPLALTPARSTDPNAWPAYGSLSPGLPAAGAGLGEAGDWERARAAAPTRGRPQEAAEAPGYWALAAAADLQAAPAAESALPVDDGDLCLDRRQRPKNEAVGSRHSLRDQWGPGARTSAGRSLISSKRLSGPLVPRPRFCRSFFFGCRRKGTEKPLNAAEDGCDCTTPKKKSAGPLARPGKYRRRAANLPEGNSCCTAQGASSASTQCPHLRHNAMRNDRMSGMIRTLSSVQCKTPQPGRPDTNQ